VRAKVATNANSARGGGSVLPRWSPGARGGERQTKNVRQSRIGAAQCNSRYSSLALLVRCSAGAPAQAPGERPTNKGRQSRISAARRNHRQISLALLTRCSGGAPGQARGERPTHKVRVGAHPCCTAGAPAQAPGERPTNKGRQSRIGAARRNHRQISLALLTRCSGGAPGQARGERPTLPTGPIRFIAA
jgi:hypothetical protein